MNDIRNPGTFYAAFPLIESLLNNREFVQAHLIAETVYDMTSHPSRYIDIPEDKHQYFLAQSAHYFARASLQLARNVGIAPEEKQKVGKKTTALAREAIEIHTRLQGIDSIQVVTDMELLAKVIHYFNDEYDDEILRLIYQAISIRSRVEGSSSLDMAFSIQDLGNTYAQRANRARAAKDQVLFVANGELALPHLVEAARIFRAVNRVDKADKVMQVVAQIEGFISKVKPNLSLVTHGSPDIQPLITADNSSDVNDKSSSSLSMNVVSEVAPQNEWSVECHKPLRAEESELSMPIDENEGCRQVIIHFFIPKYTLIYLLPHPHTPRILWRN